MRLTIPIFICLVAGAEVAPAPLEARCPRSQQEGLSQTDSVTGLPIIDLFTLDQEVQIGKEYEEEFIKAEREGGFQIDSDDKARERVGRILEPLVKVCHLPKLPWRFHVSSNPLWNANARWGGLIFVYKGLLDDVSDTELAAVLGHEIAHVTCRHQSKSLTHQKVAGIVTDRAKTAFYRASFSTEQEAEADKVGILYSALAGFDPRSVSPMWVRRHKVEGKAPRDYLNDHPLTQERAESTRRWGATASKYFLASGSVNPDYGAILVDNELVPRIGSTGNETVDFLSAALLEHLQFRKTKGEAKAREEAAAKAKEAKEAELQRKAKAMAFLKVEEVKIAKGKTGKPGVFASIKNTSNVPMKWIEIQFAYKTVNGTWEPYGNPVRLEGLPSGETRNWGITITEDKFLRTTFGARIVDLDY